MVQTMKTKINLYRKPNTKEYGSKHCEQKRKKSLPIIRSNGVLIFYHNKFVWMVTETIKKVFFCTFKNCTFVIDAYLLNDFQFIEYYFYDKHL